MDKSTTVYPQTTGSGIARMRAMNLGMNASPMKMAPMYTPTRRAATPVISDTAMLDE